MVEARGGRWWPLPWFGTVIELVSARVVRWLKAACALLSESGPMFPTQAATTLTESQAGDLTCCDGLAALYPNLKRKADLERVVEIQDLRFLGF